MSKRRYYAPVGALILAAAVLTAYMALRIGALSGLGDKVEVTVPMEDAAGVQAGAVVSVAGVEVGTVRGLDKQHDIAVVSLSIQPEAEIRKDAEVRVRSRSILGEKYVEIVPQSRDAPLLEDGDELARVGPQTEIDELVDALGPLIEAIDPEALAKVLAELSTALEDDPERLLRMLDNADVALKNSAEASEDLPELVSEGRVAVADARRAMGELEARASEARRVIERAETVLANVEESTEPLPELVDKVDAAVDDVAATLEPLRSASEDLETVLDYLAGLDESDRRQILLQEGVRVRLFPKRKFDDD